MEVRRQRHETADVQIPSGPAVEAPSDTGAEGVIHRRVTNGAGETDGVEIPRLVDKPLHANARVQLEESHRRRWIVKIRLALLHLFPEGSRKRGGIHLQPDGERRFRADPGADAAELGPCYRSVKLEGATPERLAAERIEPGRLAPFVEHRPSVLTDHLIEAGPLSSSGGHGRRVHFATCTGRLRTLQ